jgi:superfamily II DNA/RNA helicase
MNVDNESTTKRSEKIDTAEKTETIKKIETSNNSSQAAPSNETALSGSSVSHFFAEVASELLAKPQAAADFIAESGFEPTIIFCNSPSECDMVDVVLRKKSISCKKVIGETTSQKWKQLLMTVASGEVTAIITTDASSSNISITQFKLIINYSIPNDPEIYLHRTEVSDILTSDGKECVNEKVVSLVSPIDKANFYYIKKVLENKFEEIKLPSPETLVKSKYLQLKKASSSYASSDLRDAAAEFIEFRTSFLSDPDKEAVSLFLLKAYFDSLNNKPNDTTKPRPQGSKSYSKDTSPRNEQQTGRRLRGQRSSEEGMFDEEHEREGRYGRTGFGSAPFGSEGSYESRDNNASTRKKAQIHKYLRLYLNKGLSQSFSESKIKEILSSIEKVDLKHFSIRKNYSFVDVHEDYVDKSLEALQLAGLKTKRVISLNFAKEFAESENELTPSKNSSFSEMSDTEEEIERARDTNIDTLSSDEVSMSKKALFS